MSTNNSTGLLVLFCYMNAFAKKAQVAKMACCGSWMEGCQNQNFCYFILLQLIVHFSTLIISLINGYLSSMPPHTRGETKMQEWSSRALSLSLYEESYFNFLPIEKKSFKNIFLSTRIFLSHTE